jgi:hypothetical protein
MPRAYRTIPLVGLLSTLVACNSSGDKAGVGTPTGTTTTYTGAFASGTRSGTLSVSLSSGSALALYAFPTAISAQAGSGSSSASGTMVFTDGSSVSLSGTFTSSTGALALNGSSGFSLTGTLAAGTLSGTLTNGNGNGTFVALPPNNGSASKVFCGTYGGSDAGSWNVVISSLGSVSGVAASLRGGSPVTLNGTLSGTTLTLTSSDHGSAQGTLSADGSSISGTWAAVGSSGGSGAFQDATGSCGTPTPGTVPVTVPPNVSGSWVTASGANVTRAWVALLQAGSAVSGAGVLTTPPLAPISGPGTPAYTGDAYTITSGSFSGSSVTFTASLGANPAGNGTFLHGTLSFTGTLSGTNTLTGTLTFTPPATLSQTFGAQTLTGFTFTKQ